MFESASLKHSVDKAQFKREEPKLREALLNAQFDLSAKKKFPVLVVIGGVEGAGKGETVNLLHEWMDPRHILTSAFDDPTQDERERPPMWRYWRALPGKGRLGIFFGAWHSWPIVERVFGKLSDAQLDQHISSARRFEKMLSDEGALILKFWFHLTKKQQKKRLEELEASKETRWRVTEQEWRFFDRHDKFEKVAEHYLRRTSTGEAPWIVVAGADPHYRALTVGKTLLAAMRERLDEKPARAAPDKSPPLLPSVDKLNVIRALKLEQPMERDEYERALEKWQGRLALLSRHKRFGKLAVVAVFEGNDAAGKGGAIRRITQALDARLYRGVSIAAPTEEERAQPYLWRFWRHIPRRGRISIFDRSWYGRVLVERVEGFCSEADWMRAYSEINDFESELARHHIVVVKFWLAISQEEQMKRFKAREATSFKRFKITEEDWRNRKKWDDYETAVCDMVDRTSTQRASWTLVEANNKYFARIKVLKTLVKALEAKLEE
ncbi:MAG: polyphosphate:AMP phosphotransferase [Archangiaceae bacterium]|nr:polyphosphate:AMP phosphotransferase [Archangiaceae bacterium]